MVGLGWKRPFVWPAICCSLPALFALGPHTRAGEHGATVAAVFGATADRGGDSEQADAGGEVRASSGAVTFHFDQGMLKRLHLSFIAHGHLDEAKQGQRVAFGIQDPPVLQVEYRSGIFSRIVACRLRTRGAFLIDKPSGRAVIGNLLIEADADGALAIKSTLEADGSSPTVFNLESVMVEPGQEARELRLIAELAVSASWGQALDIPAAIGAVVGTVVIEVPTRLIGGMEQVPAEGAGGAPGGRLPSATGPDVVVGDLQNIIRYGSLGGITALAVGTTSCNVGDQRLSWIASTNEHPVILQSAYRLMDDRFEQVGLAWIKHGFFAVSGSLCTPCNDQTDGSELGVGCSDPYSASLNGVQSNMSPRSIVNAETGYFPYPYSVPPASSLIERRLQIHDADLDPALNPQARYFVEGQYIAADDAAAGNDNNNASYREAFVTMPFPGEFGLIVIAGFNTHIGQAGVRAWQDVDASVVETNIQVPGEGLFILAAKAAFQGTGVWRYSYALENLNSDRGCRSFSVPLPPGIVVSNVGFHDVDYHGAEEPYDLTDWVADVAPESITWSTDDFATNENANALRYGTVYSFYFDTPVGPGGPTTVTLGLFKPGLHANNISAESIGPSGFADCNGNGVADGLDIANGTSTDCTENGVPDECDIASGVSEDLNGDGTPDECQIPAVPLPPSDVEHQARKHRYLSINSSTNGAVVVALRVDLISMKRCSGLPGRACTVDADCEDAVPGSGTCVEHADVATAGPWWVQAPQQEPLGCPPDNTCGDDDWFARLDATPHYDTWALATLHVGDCEVIPVATYEVRACLPPDGVVCGAAMTIATVAQSLVSPGFRGNFGDVAGPVDGTTLQFAPPNGVTNVDDILAYLLT
ncbi:MAG: hypothetical protein ACE5HE_13150, partial [Phycisphaerae bacterium]